MPSSSAPQGWFSGIPSVIDYGSAVVEFSGDVVTEALDTVLAQQTQKLRDQARSLPEWGPYADNLTVTYDPASQEVVFSASGPPEALARIKDIEYGVTNKVHASGLLRKNAAATLDIELAVNRHIGRTLT